MQAESQNSSGRATGASERALVVAAIAFVALLISILLGTLLGPRLGRLEWLSPTLLVCGLLLIIWSASLLILALPGLLKFVRCGSPIKVPISVITPLFLMMGGVILISAFAARARDVSPSISLVSSYVIAAESGQVALPRPPAERARDYFIVVFDDAEGSSKDCNDADFGRGQRVHQAYKPAIHLVAAALRHCARPGKIPEVDVRGFASSSKFAHCPSRTEGDGRMTSDELNLSLAQRRRQAVIDEVRSIARTPNDLAIYQEDSSRRWASVGDMNHEMRVIDAADAVYSPVRGILTRRADIVITNLGDCTQELAQPSPTAAPSGILEVQSESVDSRSSR